MLTADERLHNARLIGSFHVYKALGYRTAYKDWLASLSREAGYFIRRYAERGEWGQVDLSEGQPITMEIPDLSGFARALAQASESAAAELLRFGIAVRDAIMVPQLPGLPEGYGVTTWKWEGQEETIPPSGPDVVRDFMVDCARLNFRVQMFIHYVPEPVAEWVSQRWPAAWLPGMARATVDNWRAEWGQRLREWWVGLHPA